MAFRSKLVMFINGSLDAGLKKNVTDGLLPYKLIAKVRVEPINKKQNEGIAANLIIINPRSLYADKHRFDSTFPVRSGIKGDFFVDARDAYFSIANALRSARESVCLVAAFQSFTSLCGNFNDVIFSRF